MPNDQSQNRLDIALARLQSQIEDVKTRTSPGSILQTGPLSPQELFGIVVANEVCMMMSLYDLIVVLNGPEFVGPVQNTHEN